MRTLTAHELQQRLFTAHGADYVATIAEIGERLKDGRAVLMPQGIPRYSPTAYQPSACVGGDID